MKINTLYVPSLDNDDNITGYSRIIFPEIEKTDEELANIKEYAIASKIGTYNSLIGHITNEPGFIKEDPDLIIHEEKVGSFESALNIFGYTMRR